MIRKERKSFWRPETYDSMNILWLSTLRSKACRWIPSIPYHTFAGQHIVFNGGGYFRLIPYGIIRKWTKEIAGQARNEGIGTRNEWIGSCNEGYCLSYIHPRDLDAGQPMLEGLPAARFKSYVGLKGGRKEVKKIPDGVPVYGYCHCWESNQLGEGATDLACITS